MNESVATLHGIGPIVVTGTPTYNLDNVRDLRVDTKIAQWLELAGGAVDPNFVAVFMTESRYAIGYLAWWTAVLTVFN